MSELKAPVYPKAMRDKAAKEKLSLVTIDIDGRPGKWLGRITFQGPMTKAEAHAAIRLIKRWASRDKRK